MLYLAIALFAVAAILGITIFIYWLNKKDASRAVVFSHGGVAATALVLTIIYSINHSDNYPKISIILFIIAAIGGFYMFFKDLSRRSPSIGVGIIHALVAVSGFIALLLFVI
jgi:hypothetical protein